MKIVTWNCNGALRKKFENLLDFDADIYVVQECENPEENGQKSYREWASNYLWIGDTKNKGLAIFAKEGIELTKLDWSNQYQDHSVKHFLPCRVNQDFNLIGVWTHRNNSPNFGYIGQLWKYLEVNKGKLETALIVGDFNSNVIWDEWDRWWNHSDVVNELKELGIESLYHKYTGELQGEEITPTLYFQRKIERPYHIDYFFGSQKFSKKIIKVEVGKVNSWLEVSDHMPILCEFKF